MFKRRDESETVRVVREIEFIKKRGVRQQKKWLEKMENDTGIAEWRFGGPRIVAFGRSRQGWPTPNSQTKK